MRGFKDVVYPGLMPGVDLVVRQVDRRIQLSLRIAAGVCLENVVLRVDGLDSLQFGTASRLIGSTEAGSLALGPCTLVQTTCAGPARKLSCSLVALTNDRIGFSAPGRDEDLPIEINAGIDWLTLLGGSGSEYATGVAIAPGGDVVVTGRTNSADFPVTPGVVDTTLGSFDLFVSRLSATGAAMIFSTYIGGSGDDQDPAGIGIAADGTICLAGATYSADFPVTPGAYDRTFGGEEDMFALRLSPDGQTLLWSTFYGDSSTASLGEHLKAMGIAPDGSIYVAGYVQMPAATFPVTQGAFDPTLNGHDECVIAHISADGATLLQSTFLGGSSTDRATGMVLQTDGVVVVGFTLSPNFPVTSGAYDTSPPGGFVTKFDLALSRLMFSTMLGNSLKRVATHASGDLTIIGTTTAPTFPVTPGAFDITFNGSNDAFVARLSPTGSTLTYSTYLGGSANDGATSLVVDNAGVATVGGGTWWSSGFPVTTGAYQGSGEAWNDPFVSRLSPEGSGLWYSTLIPGNNDDTNFNSQSDLALLPDESVIFVSFTQSTDFPVSAGAYDGTLGGIQDAFVTKLSMLPNGVTRYGNSTPGCAGYLAMGVTVMPQLGLPFTLTCTNVKPLSAQGMLVLGLSDLSQPLMAKGAELWVNPSPLLLLLPMTSNSAGFTTFGATLPSDPGLAGVTFTTQVFWPDDCAPAGPLAASNALAVTLQP
jgi:hypothetical protein